MPILVYLVYYSACLNTRVGAPNQGVEAERLFQKKGMYDGIHLPRPERIPVTWKQLAAAGRS